MPKLKYPVVVVVAIALLALARLQRHVGWPRPRAGEQVGENYNPLRRLLLSHTQTVEHPMSTKTKGEYLYSDGGDDTTLSAPVSEVAMEFESTRPLIHVFNLYQDPGTDDIFSPIGHEQWIMLDSLRSAKTAFYNKRLEGSVDSSSAFDSVIIVCALLEQDVQVLSLITSHYCDHTSVLPRSTATDHPHLKPLPYLQDIFDAGTSIVGEDDGPFHLMYTNSDISVTEGFYSYVESNLGAGIASLSVNRMSLDFDYLQLLKEVHGNRVHTIDGKTAISPDSSFETKAWAANQFVKQAIGSVENGRWEKHPGHDCFVMYSNLLKAIDFGDLFIGYPPLGSTIVNVLKIMSKNYPMLRSNNEGSFHVGDDRTWLVKTQTRRNQEWYTGPKEDLDNMLFCPPSWAIPKEEHTLQNIINCGKLFRPKKEGSIVPAFVRPGYDTMFLNRYWRWLSYSKEGFDNGRSGMKLKWKYSWKK